MGFSGRAALAAAAVLLAATAHAQEPQGQRIDFAPGATEASVEGAISGFATATYLVDAAAGQEMRVTLEAENPQTVFNVVAPGAATPLFNGARKGRAFDGTLAAGGPYAIEIALARDAARRSEASAYTLTVAVTGTPVPGAATAPAAAGGDFADGLAGGPDFWEVANLAPDATLAVRAAPGDAAVVAEVAPGTLLANGGCRFVAGGRWCQVTGRDDPAVSGWASGRNLREATGVAAPAAAIPAPSDAPAPPLAATEVACATAPELPLAACGFTLDRADGAAVVRVALPSGGTRLIRFVNGEALTSDGVGGFTARRDAGMTKIGIGEERFEIPDALVRGG